jgi:uncharacterized sulfatase
MDRRQFLRTASAAAGGAIIAGLGMTDTAAAAVGSAPGRPKPGYAQPNIVFIVVDEMRFPTVFPAGITTAGEFLEKFMPNLHGLWSKGVKFSRNYTAGTACSPGRAAFVTGLYPHQNWLLQTRKGAGGVGRQAPALQPAFPTYGKLLAAAGYETPYVGKWHLSDAPDPGSSGASTYLNNYGFSGLTIPDVIGDNGDGVNYDGAIAQTAVDWLQQRTSSQSPFCLTVSFVNAHDKEYFWAGTEADTYNALYARNPPAVPTAMYSQPPVEGDPPVYGYPVVPPNWESLKTLRAKKPGCQLYVREFTALTWGGVNDDPGATDFSLQPYPFVQPDKTYQIARAPFSYWSRGLDSYTQMMSMVDQHIGAVVSAVPADVANDTVFVFTSDHGEYAGAHGLSTNKAGTGYEEAFRVPLIVTDPSGRFTADTASVRTQLTTSVDLLPMFANLGYGSRSWMTGDLAKVYNERLDLMPLLKRSDASGRSHVVLASDEWVPNAFNFNRSAAHILVLRTSEAKLVVYSKWARGSSRMLDRGMELEFYDYSTAKGRQELDNKPHDSRAAVMLDQLRHDFLPRQMQQPLPGTLQTASSNAEADYVAYIAYLDAIPVRNFDGGKLATLVGYGRGI